MPIKKLKKNINLCVQYFPEHTDDTDPYINNPGSFVGHYANTIVKIYSDHKLLIVFLDAI